MVSQVRLKELLEYEPSSGIFRWRIYRGRGARVGAVAGTAHSGGYLSIKIDGKRYFAHRLAWQYMKGAQPSDQIDHIDLNKTNNCISNLRVATPKQNSRNTPTRSLTGLKGVTAVKSRYIARIKVGRKNVSLGSFDTPQLAHTAYAVAARKHFGEFARLN